MAAKRRRKNAKWPETGTLEQNVDGILRAHGLQLNSTPDKLIEKSKRRTQHAFVKRPSRAKSLG